MDKLRVAVLMEDCLPTEGGGYSYYQTLLMAIDRHNFHPDIEIVYIDFFNSANKQLQFSKQLIRVKRSVFGAVAYRCLNLLYKIVHRLLQSHSRVYLEFISKRMDAINNRAIRKILTKENIHLIYYLKPRENFIDYPMIVTHWDVGHKSMYPFPEVTWNGNFKKRDNYYKTILNKAFLILCESETGAKELKHYYPVNPAKIKVMPLFGGDVVSITVTEKEQLQLLSGYNLVKGSFYLYPAQFWAHKNHSTLIYAFKLLLNQDGNQSLKLVLCGGDQGNLSYIKKLIDESALNDNILVPGFISGKHLYALYKNAIALVMPTFLGPTNIPLIEAAELECAIVCSDLEGHKEILRDNALYFDPSSASEIQDCMQQVLNNKFREQLVSSAYHFIRNSSFQVQRSIPLLDRFLQELKPVRTTWGMGIKLFFAFAKIGILSIN